MIFGAIGAAAGFLYWYLVGCRGGVCPIWAVWWRSTLYGGVMGGLIGSIIQDLLRKKPSTPPANQP